MEKTDGVKDLVVFFLAKEIFKLLIVFAAGVANRTDGAQNRRDNDRPGAGVYVGIGVNVKD